MDVHAQQRGVVAHPVGEARVVVARPEIGEVRLLVELLAGEEIVGRARGGTRILVQLPVAPHVAIGEVLDVLMDPAAAVGHPPGRAEVIGVVVVRGRLQPGVRRRQRHPLDAFRRRPAAGRHPGRSVTLVALPASGGPPPNSATSSATGISFDAMRAPPGEEMLGGVVAALDREELPDGEAGRAPAELDDALAGGVVEEAGDVAAAVHHLAQPVLLRPVIAAPVVMACRLDAVAHVLGAGAASAVRPALDGGVAVVVVGQREVADGDGLVRPRRRRVPVDVVVVRLRRRLGVAGAVQKLAHLRVAGQVVDVGVREAREVPVDQPGPGVGGSVGADHAVQGVVLGRSAPPSCCWRWRRAPRQARRSGRARLPTRS